jgi:hypothetical protein
MSQLEGIIGATVEEARRRWPSVRVELDGFASYLQARIPDERTLESLQILDLYLACACGEGQAAAIEAFRDTYLPAIEAHLRSMRVPDATIQDLIARLGEELFTARSNAPRRLASTRAEAACASGFRSSSRAWRCERSSTRSATRRSMLHRARNWSTPPARSSRT